MADRSNQPVFIHCGSANRVGAVWMIKRTLQDKWTAEKAPRRGRGHRSQKRGAQDLRSRVHQDASVTFKILALGSRLRNLESEPWALR